MPQYRIETGDIVEDTRTESQYEVVFEDEQSVLIRNEHTRLEERGPFETNLDAGRFKIQNVDSKTRKVDSGASDGVESSSEEIPLEEIDNVGEVSASNLREKGLVTEKDFQTASDEKILSCHGVGEKALNNIREYAG
jgi:ERCC4-type nuclease